MREKLFTLSRTPREGMGRRFKQTDDRRVAERPHTILLLDSGQNTDAVSRILHVHPKTLKRWIKAFASGDEAARTNFNSVGDDGWLTDEQQQQFTTGLDACARSTTEAVVAVEEQFGLSYSDSGMRKLIGQPVSGYYMQRFLRDPVEFLFDRERQVRLLAQLRPRRSPSPSWPRGVAS